jgi:acetate kinase
MSVVLVLNAGSSSIKFAAFDRATTPRVLKLIGRGHVKQAGAEVEMLVRNADGAVLERSHCGLANGAFDHDKGTGPHVQRLDEHRGGLELGSRPSRRARRSVVLGAGAGDRWQCSTISKRSCRWPSAPAAQPQGDPFPARIHPHVAAGRLFRYRVSHHAAGVAQAYALPREITGAACAHVFTACLQYIASQLPRVLGDRAHGKVVVAHLGSGASLCGMINGRSVASTMGFSALDGLVMGTRCGTLDPGVVLYMMQSLNLTPAEVSDLLYTRSGLLGVSGISNDMQILLASADRRATEAVDLFVHRIVCEIGSLAAAMGGVDALVFTAGIGEHAAAIRSRVARGCEWLGATIDEESNTMRRELIHAPSSRVQLVVMATDEEKMIATHTSRRACRPPEGAVAHARSTLTSPPPQSALNTSLGIAGGRWWHWSGRMALAEAFLKGIATAGWVGA